MLRMEVLARWCSPTQLPRGASKVPRPIPKGLEERHSVVGSVGSETSPAKIVLTYICSTLFNLIKPSFNSLAFLFSALDSEVSKVLIASSIFFSISARSGSGSPLSLSYYELVAQNGKGNQYLRNICRRSEMIHTRHSIEPTLNRHTILSRPPHLS